VVVGAKTTPDVQEGEIVGWQLTPPFPQLRDVVAWGVSEAAEPDRTVRRHHYREDLDKPSMAWRAAEKTMPRPPPPFEPRWINYYGKPGLLSHFSYYQVFETNQADAIARGCQQGRLCRRSIALASQAENDLTIMRPALIGPTAVRLVLRFRDGVNEPLPRRLASPTVPGSGTLRDCPAPVCVRIHAGDSASGGGGWFCRAGFPVGRRRRCL
jgi:hypothetical protein